MSMLHSLEKLRVDWTDFETASRVTQELAQELAADRRLLRRMALSVERNPALLALAEKHNELNYIVLYDALDRGWRIRLHRFSQGLEDIPHNHRFSFSSTLLQGSYVHTIYEVDRAGPDAAATDIWSIRQPRGTGVNVQIDEIPLTGFKPLLATTQATGSTYSLHHTSVHKTAMPKEDAFSVFVRSPSQKPCALQLEPAERAYRWKFGQKDEDASVLAERRMTHTDYRQFIESLDRAHVI